MPVPRFAGDPTRTYRSLRLGRTAELFAIDSRQYRDDQPCGDNVLTGLAVCPDADAPGRTLLGSAQKSWLVNGLRKSGAQWKLLANQNMLMGMVAGAQGERAWLDTWDGYGAERTEVLTAASRLSNVLAITGDGGEEAARAEERNRLAHNTHLKLIDMVQHGYGVLEVDRQQARFTFRAVDKLDPAAGATTSYIRTVPTGQAVIDEQ